MKKQIRIKFQNGLSFDEFKKDVFDINLISDKYEFINSDKPDFIVFGPYGNDIPKEGKYTRIGYFCENIIPDFSNCEWALGVPNEEFIKNTKYKRIQWHGTDPKMLIKPQDFNPEIMLSEKTKFCNFIYSNPVAYREEFLRQLSKYKKVDSPGKSMNNMQWPQNNQSADKWTVKRNLLKQYKFTIAFENYVFPGYQTEKIYDAMLSNSIPIYCGDPLIGNIFNTESFLNVSDYIFPKDNFIINYLEKTGASNFTDIRPQYFKDPKHRIIRKVKSIKRQLKMRLKYNGLDFTNLIDRIIEIDNDDDLYIEYQRKQWLKDTSDKEIIDTNNFWSKIFDSNNA